MNPSYEQPRPPGLPRLLDELQRGLAELDARALRRRLRPTAPGSPADPGTRLVRRDGRDLVNLASNDYLALADHPRLKAAAVDATQRFGTGAGASRLVTGHLDLHAAAEAAFTAFKHPAQTGAPTEAGDGPARDDDPRHPAPGYASLLLPTGYLANLAVLTTLAGPHDRIFLDKLCHASLIDAARASGAEVRAFPHLGYAKLERLLARRTGEGGASSVEGAESATSPSTLDTPRSTAASRRPRTFVVTDSVFSMDGDTADLPALCDLADAHGAILVVDEAHGTGVLGASGAGLCEHQGVSGRVPIVISTASKALGGLGGIVTAPTPIIDALVNHARPFIYTTATPPAQPAVLLAALDVLRDEPWRRERLAELSSRLGRELRRRGWPEPRSGSAAGSGKREAQDRPHPLRASRFAIPATPIFPLIVGDAPAALALADRLEAHGCLAVAIRPPTVAPGAARVRVSLRCDLTDDDVERLLDALPNPPREG